MASHKALALTALLCVILGAAASAGKPGFQPSRPGIGALRNFLTALSAGKKGSWAGGCHLATSDVAKPKLSRHRLAPSV